MLKKNQSTLVFNYSRWIILMLSLMMVSCAYKISHRQDSMPENVQKIYVPLFKNISDEEGIEVYYTNAIKKELLKSHLVTLVNDEKDADGVIYGEITHVKTVSDESVSESKNTAYLPRNTVLSTQVVLTVTTNVKLKRKGSTEVLWSGVFKQSANYTPPQVTLPVINTTNHLYNLSARRQTLDTLSQEMMQLAYDRMVDRF